MSALAALSLIAPAAPTALQGTAGEDASLFQGLLNGVQGETAPAVAPTSVGFLKTPPGEAVPEVKLDDGQIAAEAAAIGMASVAPPVSSAMPTTAGSQGETSPDDSAEGAAQKTQAKTADAPPSVAPAFVPVVSVSTAAASGTSPGAGQAAASPVQSGPVADETSDAAVPPAAADDAVAQAALERAVSPAEAVKTAQATSPLAVPTPLKPLTERTARPLDAAARANASGAYGAQAAAYAPADPMKTAASPAAPVQPVDAGAAASGSPSTPVEAAAAAVADAALPDDAEAGLRPAPLESSGAATQAAGPREAALSSLSRTTIDATAQIAAQILRKLEGRSTRFEMSLTPDDLGRVDVKLDIDAEGRLAARLAFDNPAAAADLRGRADELRRQLQDAGFHLADDAFEFADRDSGSSAFDRGQGGDGRQNRAFNAASRLNAETDIVPPPRWMALSLTPAGVDLKV
jgi:flagellar hook-length control protein FliK